MKTLVIAPHPDDETLGCGGALFRRKEEGAELGWLIVTEASESLGWSSKAVQQRDTEIKTVAEKIGFDRVYNLGLPSAQLDQLKTVDLVNKFSTVFKEFEPEEVLLPSRSDAHTDHQLVFDAVGACSKWFRYPSVKRILAYETLSETNFNLNPDATFNPNYFIDISEYLERKLEVLAIYKSELGDFPFPRSVEAIRSLATFRGASSGFVAAEAFQLLRERY
jgi:N-acetylglucosamine malate deacetylase 1